MSTIMRDSFSDHLDWRRHCAARDGSAAEGSRYVQEPGDRRKSRPRTVALIRSQSNNSIANYIEIKYFALPLSIPIFPAEPAISAIAGFRQRVGQQAHGLGKRGCLFRAQRRGDLPLRVDDGGDHLIDYAH